MTKRKTIEEFIEESKIKHGKDRYSYDRCLEYKNNKTKLELYCNECLSYFFTYPNDHLGIKLTGCSVCSNKNKKQRTSERTYLDLVSIANEIHDNKYEYENTLDVYSNTSYLNITCKKHGVFKKNTYDHIRKDKPGGCPKCVYDSRRTSSKEYEKYLEKNKIFFNNKYDYSLIDSSLISSISEDVSIICPTHGVFKQRFYSHFILKNDCNKCSKSLNIEDLEKSIRAQDIPNIDLTGIKIKNSKSNFINDAVVTNIKCLEHNSIFSLTYPVFRNNTPRCSVCSSRASKEELSIVSYIRNLKPSIELIHSYRPTWMLGQELDIFLPEYNLAIEYNGTAYHHSSKSLEVNSFFLRHTKPKEYHYNKWKLCKDNGITLLSIYDFYWFIEQKQNIYKSKIAHYLHMDTKLYARSCIIKEISNDEAKELYDNNHLEGSGFRYKDSKSYGLFYENKLIMSATIGKYYNQSSKVFELKLSRICTLKGYTVIGGVSKLSKHLKSLYGAYKYQITLSTGGSTLTYYDYSNVQPRYFWIHPSSLKYLQRNETQKSLLEKKFKKPLLPNDTETSYMEKLGYLKVYDNGITTLSI